MSYDVDTFEAGFSFSAASFVLVHHCISLTASSMWNLVFLSLNFMHFIDDQTFLAGKYKKKYRNRYLMKYL